MPVPSCIINGSRSALYDLALPSLEFCGVCRKICVKKADVLFVFGNSLIFLALFNTPRERKSPRHDPTLCFMYEYM